MLFGLHAKEITNRCSGSPPPHHCQGYLKRQIFENNADRDSFLARLGGILKETEIRLRRTTPGHLFPIIFIYC